jgi:uncharacterized protein YcgL (UPF0745 family)
MYLYLDQENAFDKVPPALRELFGPAQPVMRLDLHPARRLAREDVNQVIANLRARGFHLQMPPLQPPELLHS